MATVVVLSRDATMALVGDAVVNGDWNGSGELILTQQDSTTINVGQANHGLLTGLADDDHTQYAKADGSRGAFATEAQGDTADAARPNLKSTTSFDGGADSNAVIVETFQITIDGTDAGDWPDRWRWKIRNGAGSYRYVTYLNEYGEIRSLPARHDTVACRWFVIDSASLTDGTSRNTGVPIMELMNDRVNRDSLWAVMPNGDQAFHDVDGVYVRMARVLVLEEGVDVPDGTPAGTLIIRIPA